MAEYDNPDGLDGTKAWNWEKIMEGKTSVSVAFTVLTISTKISTLLGRRVLGVGKWISTADG